MNLPAPTLAVWCCSSKQHTSTHKVTGVQKHNVFFSVAAAPYVGPYKLRWESNPTWYEVCPFKPWFIVTGWSLMGGLIRPPSMPGRFIRNFFPHFMLVHSGMLTELYAIAATLADHYNVPLAPYDEALAPCLVGEWHHKNLPGLTATLSVGEVKASDTVSFTVENTAPTAGKLLDRTLPKDVD